MIVKTAKKESITRNIRMPKELLERVKKAAKEKRWSVNAFIVYAVEDVLSARSSG